MAKGKGSVEKWVAPLPDEGEDAEGGHREDQAGLRAPRGVGWDPHPRHALLAPRDPPGAFRRVGPRRGPVPGAPRGLQAPGPRVEPVRPALPGGAPPRGLGGASPSEGDHHAPVRLRRRIALPPATSPAMARNPRHSSASPKKLVPVAVSSAPAPDESGDLDADGGFGGLAPLPSLGPGPMFRLNGSTTTTFASVFARLPRSESFAGSVREVGGVGWSSPPVKSQPTTATNAPRQSEEMNKRDMASILIWRSGASLPSPFYTSPTRKRGIPRVAAASSRRSVLRPVSSPSHVRRRSGLPARRETFGQPCGTVGRPATT